MVFLENIIMVYIMPSKSLHQSMLLTIGHRIFDVLPDLEGECSFQYMGKGADDSQLKIVKSIHPIKCTRLG